MEGLMSNSVFAREGVFRPSKWRPVEHNLIDRRRYDALAAELQASLAREDALRDEKNDLAQRQAMLAQEFEHRVANGLQLIASPLSLQSRTMPTPEARIQLGLAARRVIALGTVHHRLHLLDQPANVELNNFSSVCATIFLTCYSKTEPIMQSRSRGPRPRCRHRSPVRLGLSQTS
jgi:two-component sensor histidine kinase